MANLTHKSIKGEFCPLTKLQKKSRNMKPAEGEYGSTAFDDTNIDYERKKSNVSEVDINSKWNLLPLILKSTGLTKLQLNSFNDFIDFGLTRIMKANQRVILSENPLRYIQYKSINVEKPYYSKRKIPLTPQNCRLTGMTYAGNVYVDFDYFNGKTIESKTHFHIAKLPIMLQSNRCHLYNASEEEFAKLGECPYDPGCYFIIRGTERVVLVQEQSPYNRILIEGSGTEERQAICNSSTDTHKTRIELLWRKKNLKLHHNMLKEDLPVFILFRALGVTSDQEIMQMIDPLGKVSNLLITSKQESINSKIFTQDQAIQYIETKLRDQKLSGIVATKEERALPNYKAREFLRTMFVPHIQSTLTEFKKKAVFFSLMVRWLLMSLLNPNEDPNKILDSRDFFGNKKLELAGELIDLLFEDLFKTFNLCVQNYHKRSNLKSKNDNTAIDASMVSDIITNGLNATISSGNWNITRFKMSRAGVSQPLARISYLNFLSMITRISSHFEKTQKVTGPRSLYPSQFGFVCPSDTPEGAQCGLVKNFTLTSHVTVFSDPAPIKRILYDLGVEDLMPMSGEECAKNVVVILNGEPIGITNEPEKICKAFRTARRHSIIKDRYVSIWFSTPKQCIFISTESGRVCRPLIIVENHKSKLTLPMINAIAQKDPKYSLNYLIENGIIEYVDVNELHDTFIAFYEVDLVNHPKNDYTHLEIHNAQLLGVCASVIPCPHHNQSPRNTYQCAMGKQAVGPTALNIFNRIDQSSYFLCYPQQPMVQTRALRLARYHEMPCGHTAMVAVMSYSGHDIEDALIMNKASLDRGFARRYYLSKIDITIKTYDNATSDQIVDLAHDKRINRDEPSYANMDDDGLVKTEVELQANQFYANKYVPDTPERYKSTPLRYSDAYPVHVHKVYAGTTDRGIDYTIKTRDFRRPELGDKFSSRHGQKGVLGLIVEQEDMPYTETGVCPDMIMNPHGFPSRMTVGKMIELISGKAGIANGQIGNGTVFSSDPVKDISEDLIKAGFSFSGKELLMSGITGEPLEAYIFFGPVFYQSLKHMVKDKMQARPAGQSQYLTRQPTQGRSRKGGMRLGEMERDCLIGHGAASILYERMLISSDLYVANVCENCGLIGYTNNCTECKAKAKMKKVKMPYACKLLFQELISMGITPRLRVGDF